MERLLNPANLVAITIFLAFLIMFMSKIIYINREFRFLISLLKNFKKNDLLYRFQELNEAMLGNPFIADYWREFTDTLVFKDKVIYKSGNDQLCFDSVTASEAAIFCTTDSNYFFNESTLIHNKLNHKFISSIPSLLTGLGPLGTFLYISIGFSSVDFSSEESTINSVTNLLSCLEVAAIISILAIGSSLLFIVIERLLYNLLCKKPLLSLQIEVNRLFDKITPEKFYIEMIKEAKIQNNSINSFLQTLPENIRNSFDHSILAHLTPYLENIIYLLNQSQESNKNDLNDIFDLGN